MAPVSQLRSNRAAAQQQILRNIENEKFDPANVDPRSKEDTQMFIDHMQATLDSQLSLLMAEKESHINKLKQVFGNGVTKMAKGSRQMTIAEFNVVNDCDIVSIVRKTKESFPVPTAVATASSSSSSSCTAAASSALVLETPAMRRRNMHVDPTPPRTARRGEQVLSQNGSPIDLYEEGTLVATVTKNRREPSLEIHVGQGKFINIDDAQQMKAASAGKKAVARENLHALRNKIDQLMAEL